jgi:hypothetical protein
MVGVNCTQDIVIQSFGPFGRLGRVLFWIVFVSQGNTFLSLFQRDAFFEVRPRRNGPIAFASWRHTMMAVEESRRTCSWP